MARQKDCWCGWWRPSETPSVSLPLGARSVGRCDGPPGFVIPTGTLRSFHNAFWTVEGEGVMEYGNGEIRLEPGALAIFAPGERVAGRAGERGWRYRWFTADAPAAKAIFEAYGLAPPWPRSAGPCPEALFDRLEAEIEDPSPEAEIRCGALLFEILGQAGHGPAATESARPGQRFAEAAARLMEQNFADPEMTVDALARDLGVHRSRLSRCFRERFGIPPTRYLTRVRLGRALALLRQSDAPVNEVARTVGFTDPAYFSRRLRELTGASPRELRERKS